MMGFLSKRCCYCRRKHIRKELRGPAGDRGVDNDYYDKVKAWVGGKKGVRPHVVVRIQGHVARLSQSDGAAPVVRTRGMYIEYEKVISCTSKRLPGKLEKADAKQIHLCRCDGCADDKECAAHSGAYATVPVDTVWDPMDYYPRRHWWVACACLRLCSLGLNGCWGCGCCLCRCGKRRSSAKSVDLLVGGRLSETESEPDEPKCQAHLVCYQDDNKRVCTLSLARCCDRACSKGLRMLDEDAYTTGSLLENEEEGLVRLCKYHTQVYTCDRLILKCAKEGCRRKGWEVRSGIKLCRGHAEVIELGGEAVAAGAEPGRRASPVAPHPGCHVAIKLQRAGDSEDRRDYQRRARFRADLKPDTDDGQWRGVHIPRLGLDLQVREYLPLASDYLG